MTIAGHAPALTLGPDSLLDEEHGARCPHCPLADCQLTTDTLTRPPEPQVRGWANPSTNPQHRERQRGCCFKLFSNGQGGLLGGQSYLIQRRIPSPERWERAAACPRSRDVSGKASRLWQLPGDPCWSPPQYRLLSTEMERPCAVLPALCWVWHISYFQETYNFHFVFHRGNCNLIVLLM